MALAHTDSPTPTGAGHDQPVPAELPADVNPADVNPADVNPADVSFDRARPDGA